MKKYIEVEVTKTEKQIESMYCNKCAREIWTDKKEHYHTTEEGYWQLTEAGRAAYHSTPQHGVSVKVTGGYDNVILGDCSVRYFDICEECIMEYMNSFSISPALGGYSPIPGFDTTDKEENL